MKKNAIALKILMIIGVKMVVKMVGIRMTDDWEDTDPNPPADQASLVPLGANAATVTVSGYSSGGMMSNIMVILMSDTIMGAGMIAGTPFATKNDLNEPNMDTATQISDFCIARATQS
jgi:hypothetical protein